MHKVMTGGAAATKVLFKPTGQMKAYGEMGDAARAFVDNGLGKSSLAHLTKDEKFYDPLVGAKGIAGKIDKATDILCGSIFQRFGNHEHDKSVRLFRIQSKATRKRKPKSPDGKNLSRCRNGSEKDSL